MKKQADRDKKKKKKDLEPMILEILQKSLEAALRKSLNELFEEFK
jgi:hypothetical protein